MKTTFKKKYKYIGILLIIFTVYPFANLYSQSNDNEFQKLFAKSQALFAKPVESLNKDDLAELKELIAIKSNQFGEENIRLCNNVIEQAKKKKAEYDEYIARSNKMSSTLDELDTEAQLRMAAEQTVETLSIENSDLKQIITTLEAQIQKYEAQTKKLSSINDKLLSEKRAANELLQTSSDLVAQMLNLIGNVKFDENVYDSLPQNIKDSLELAQCGVTQMMKSNFLITINQLRSNQQFMDTASLYYHTNNKHSAEIQGYIDNCNSLVEHLRKSGISCAMNYASDIEENMNDFLIEIENRENDGWVLVSFLLDNIFWIAPICLILLILIVVLIRKTSKAKI